MAPMPRQGDDPDDLKRSDRRADSQAEGGESDANLRSGDGSPLPTATPSNSDADLTWLARSTRGVWFLALPILFAQIGETIIAITDTILLAQVGTTELAAVGMADAIYDLSRVLLIGLVDGLQIIIARRVGQRKYAAVGDTFNQGLCVLVLISLVLTAGLKLASPLVARGLLSSEELGAAVDDFLQIAAYGIVFHSINLAYSALLVGLGRTRALTGATIVLGVTNFCVGYCLIFGKFGLPELGIRGAAIGSVAAEAAAFAYLTFHTLRYANVRQYALFRMPRLSARLIRTLWIISWPVTLQALLECVRWFVFFLILAQVSAEMLALSTIVYCGYELLLIPSEAFSEVACSQVSSLIGARQSERIGRLLRQLITLGFIATVPFMVLLIAFPGTVLSIFLDDVDLIDRAMNGLYVVALGMLAVIPGQIWLAAVTGTGDTLAAFLIELLLSVVMLGLAYITALPMEQPLEIIWLGVSLGWLACLAASYAFMKCGKWMRLQI